jgi:hypothetical protein
LQLATTKKYGPIDPIITLAKIPDESKPKVQSLSRSFLTIAEMPTMDPVLRKVILDKISFDKFVYKIWDHQRAYMKKYWKDMAECGYHSCPPEITEEYMIKIIGKNKVDFAHHIISTIPLLSQDAAIALHGIDDGVELEHALSRTPRLHKVWADKAPNPSDAAMSIFHFSAAFLAPKGANNVKGSSFIANFERVFNEDGTFSHWDNTAHNSDHLHYAYEAFQSEGISWFLKQDCVRIFFNTAIILCRRKKDYTYKIDFFLHPNFNAHTGVIELDETEGGLDTTATNESIQIGLQELDVLCSNVVIEGKTWKVGTDTTDKTNLKTVRGYLNNELKGCDHFGQISISREVIKKPGPRDFVRGVRSGDAHDRLRTLIRKQESLIKHLPTLMEGYNGCAKDGGPIHNAANIYRKRLHLCILNNFYGSNIGQRWRILNKHPEGGCLEMDILDSMSYITELAYNMCRAKKE